MKKLLELIESIRTAIIKANDDEVFSNINEWNKYANIVNEGEEILKKEYVKRLKKIEQLEKEIQEIEKASKEFRYDL